MKRRIGAAIRNFISWLAFFDANNPGVPVWADVSEEYAKAFRTESYIEFWARVQTLQDTNFNPHDKRVESTTAARLSSYRLFVEHLLDPNQTTVAGILRSAQNPPAAHALLSEYFSQTADASFLCGSIIKDVGHIRAKYESLRTAVKLFQTAPFQHAKKRFISPPNEFINPFAQSASSPNQVKVIQANCAELLKQLESSRDKATAKLHLHHRLKHCSAIFLVALTASLTVIIATHALALLVATPSLVTASLELACTRKLAKVLAQLDAAAKGTYTVIRDLDTISRLIARLSDEWDHINSTAKSWLERGEDRLQASVEMMRQPNTKHCNFSEQLDELEEHLYLSFMTINRARNLVLKGSFDSAQPDRTPNV